MNLAKSLSTIVLCCITFFATAGDIKPFSEQEFSKLTMDGKPVVLHITAPWCPTCKQQKPILKSLMIQPPYKDVTLMTIDFDTSKATLTAFKVSTQSTLVSFKGNKEVGRSVADTSPEGIEGLVKKTVN